MHVNRCETISNISLLFSRFDHINTHTQKEEEEEEEEKLMIGKRRLSPLLLCQLIIFLFVLLPPPMYVKEKRVLDEGDKSMSIFSLFARVQSCMTKIYRKRNYVEGNDRTSFVFSSIVSIEVMTSTLLLFS